MTPRRRSRPLQAGEGPQESTILDLLLDLVFVFVLNRVTEQAVHDLSGVHEVAHLGETTLLFLAIWLVWYYTALAASTFNPQRVEIQLLVFVAAFTSVLMGVSVPHAYDGHGLIFVGAYVMIQVGRPLVLTMLQRGSGQPPIPTRMLTWSLVSAVPWIAGALVPGSLARGLLWTLATAIDYAGISTGWPTPWLGRTQVSEWTLVGEYLADRYRQFFVIVLGESILLSGLTFSTDEFALEPTIAFILAFSTTALYWRIYFYRAGSVLKRAVTLSKQPIFLVAHGFYTHLGMALGVTASTVGHGLVIMHPASATNPVWTGVILGGPALFLCARIRFEYDVFARMSPSRLVGVAALILLYPLTLRLPLLAVTTAAVLVLLGIALADAVRARSTPEEIPKPPH